MNTETPIQWRVISESVIGASHKRSNKPNQDFVDFIPDKGKGLPLILAVSDGHGSSMLSDKGSQFAVTVALESINTFVQYIEKENITTVKEVKNLAEGQLARDIVRKWKAAVDKDLQEHPLPIDPSNTEQGKNPYIHYGATLLIVVITEKYIIYLQLGDGDIITVSKDGLATRPIDRDERLIGNETTSLCMSNAWSEMRIKFETISDSLPIMILTSTDGYSNSFINEEAFKKAATDILELIRSGSLSKVKKHLPHWLSKASEIGSGDDITVGIIYRLEEPALQGNMWFGVQEGGATCYDGENWQTHNKDNELTDKKVWAICQDKKGNLWFGTDTGVTCYNGENWQTYNNQDYLTYSGVRSIYQDKKDNLWFGTWDDGVTFYNGKNWNNYSNQEIKPKKKSKFQNLFPQKETLKGNKVRAICQDKNGNLWFGTDQGVTCYDGNKKWTTYTKKEGLADNTVNAICQDKNSNIWFGTEKGVTCYDGKRWKNYTTEDGLANDKVLAICQDNQRTIIE